MYFVTIFDILWKKKITDSEKELLSGKTTAVTEAEYGKQNDRRGDSRTWNGGHLAPGRCSRRRRKRWQHKLGAATAEVKKILVRNAAKAAAADRASGA